MGLEQHDSELHVLLLLLLLRTRHAEVDMIRIDGVRPRERREQETLPPLLPPVLHLLLRLLQVLILHYSPFHCAHGQSNLHPIQIHWTTQLKGQKTEQKAETHHVLRCRARKRKRRKRGARPRGRLRAAMGDMKTCNGSATNSAHTQKPRLRAFLPSAGAWWWSPLSAPLPLSFRLSLCLFASSWLDPLEEALLYMKNGSPRLGPNRILQWRRQ